ncbi:MAG: exodeoxyribonuclease VII large subunit [bacterium]
MHETLKPLSITELTQRIRSAVEPSFNSVCVEGEISGFKTYTSGHSYFTLKDAGAILNAVLFSGTRTKLPAMLMLKDGLKVRAYGAITIYPERGQYQLVVRNLEASGTGDLMQQYEELKKRLQQEGLFAPERKKPLPLFPQRIGIVTSPTGAVIHDIITVLGRRFPNLNIRLAPVKVQGEGAANSIANAIHYFNTASTWVPDVLIIGRGGGSIEDLWAFNEEPVVRAVATSKIPTISAVGHETDVTLCDFAADIRAPTPSAAAEIVIAPKAEFQKKLERLSEDLQHTLTQRMQQSMQRVDDFDIRLRAALQQKGHQFRKRVEQASGRLGVLRERQTRTLESRLALMQQRLVQAAQRKNERYRARLETLARQCELLNPLAVLDRGYSLTRTADGKLVRSITDVLPETALRTQVKDGTITSRVTP